MSADVIPFRPRAAVDTRESAPEGLTVQLAEVRVFAKFLRRRDAIRRASTIARMRREARLDNDGDAA